MDIWQIHVTSKNLSKLMLFRSVASAVAIKKTNQLEGKNRSRFKILSQIDVISTLISCKYRCNIKLQLQNVWQILVATLVATLG
jgi:hypothetical protein